jgi:hypothetical protein
VVTERVERDEQCHQRELFRRQHAREQKIGPGERQPRTPVYRHADHGR